MDTPTTISLPQFLTFAALTKAAVPSGQPHEKRVTVVHGNPNMALVATDNWTVYRLLSDSDPIPAGHYTARDLAAAAAAFKAAAHNDRDYAIESHRTPPDEGHYGHLVSRLIERDLLDTLIAEHHIPVEPEHVDGPAHLTTAADILGVPPSRSTAAQPVNNTHLTTVLRTLPGKYTRIETANTRHGLRLVSGYGDHGWTWLATIKPVK